ncbi:MAG: squalene--hopene cyclase [Phycisphaerales bacterium]
MTTLQTPAKPIAVDRPAASLPLGRRLRAAVERARDALYSKQRNDRPEFPGFHWCAELEGDSILSSEYLLMKFILGHEGAERERRLLPRIANQLRLSQRPDGSWGQYPGSPPDISACVKAYVCLKLMGDAPDAPHMARAHELIRSRGGAETINTFSMFYLACLGIVSWEACPAIPPQIVLLPRWFPFHLCKVAAWTRTMILPLALCSALQPVRRLPPGFNADELFLDLSKKTRLNKPWSADEPITWNNFFLVADRAMKLCRRVGFTPLRKVAIERAEQWIVQRVDPKTTEGLGAIFPPMVYIQVAFQALGYARTHPLIATAEKDLDAFMLDEPNADAKLDHIRLQPCFSAVWDSAIAIDALAEAGETAASDERLARACDWLRAREVLRRGDHIDNFRPEHRHLRPGVDTAMWAFEYRNDWYPDVDDTCMVARALWRAGDRPGETANRDAANRAVQWIFAMQNDDGGWAAFDRTKDRRWMEAIPFADHNAMQDPSCSDIAGRVIESLYTCGVRPEHPAIRRGVQYLFDTQQSEGCWLGRWGVNYIYGTWQAVNGLICGGVSRDHPALVKTREWLLQHQNADGGFGESANSYLDRSLMGNGPSTASQTAWAMVTLMHLCESDHPAIRRAAEFLLNEQLDEDKRPFVPAATSGPVTGALDPSLDHVHDLAGGWNEHWFTGTGFPKVFYLRYHLYRHSFPLKALARYASLTPSPIS